MGGIRGVKKGQSHPLIRPPYGGGEYNRRSIHDEKAGVGFGGLSSMANGLPNSMCGKVNRGYLLERTGMTAICGVCTLDRFGSMRGDADNA